MALSTDRMSAFFGHLASTTREASIYLLKLYSSFFSWRAHQIRSETEMGKCHVRTQHEQRNHLLETSPQGWASSLVPRSLWQGGKEFAHHGCRSEAKPPLLRNRSMTFRRWCNLPGFFTHEPPSSFMKFQGRTRRRCRRGRPRSGCSRRCPSSPSSPSSRSSRGAWPTWRRRRRER